MGKLRVVWRMENSPLAGGIACAEAGAAEALAEDAACGNNIRYRAVFDQLQIGGHAVRVDAEFELAVAAALATDDVRHRADVFIGAAGTAGDDALLHVDAAIGANLAHQVHVDLAAQLLVGLVLGRLQNLFGVGFQFADGVGIAGVHRQRNHALHGGEVQLDAAVIVSHVGGFQLFVGFEGRLCCTKYSFVTSSVSQMEDQQVVSVVMTSMPLR